jgi:3-hydroxyisobutyrate dehydrogenase-like beta-hydroxyacid dehydrogenase
VNKEMSMEIGFIGLGNMGSPMSGRLLSEAVATVHVYDLDAGAVERAVERGATAAGSPAEVADRCETVLTSLPTPAAMRAVALGEGGVVEGSRVQRLVDLSTVGATTSREVAAQLAEREIALVDAPVSGGVPGASSGSLALMVSCDPVEVEVVEPILGHLGRVFVVGEEPGQAQVMKLLNNYLSATALATTAEAMTVGAKAGLDPGLMIEVLNASSGRNSATQDKFPRAILPGTFDYGFATGLMYKDLRLFAEQAETLGVPLWIGSAVRQMWQHTGDQVGFEEDFTTVVQPLEKWAGVEIRAAEEATA